MVKKKKQSSEIQLKFLDKVASLVTDEQDEIGFIIRSMVIASMPHSRVKGIQYKRTNNRFNLTITGNEEAGGVPYGSYPRLILSWIISEVTKTKSREIVLGNSLSNFMKKLKLNVTGGKWGTVSRFKDQLRMLFCSHITISYKSEDGTGWISSQMNVADKAQIFWDPEETNDVLNLFNSKVLLGEEFYKEIISSPIPVDIRAIDALKESSLALDIYFWLTYRMSYLAKRTEISFEKLQGQFGAGYSENKYGKYEFKRKFLVQLTKVQCLYPEANIDVNDSGIILSPSATHIKMRNF